MPLVNQTFDQLLDFTRTSSATFVGSNGLIQTTPASVNLLTWTQQFDNAAWPKTALTATANSTVAPDGTSTADTLTDTAATSNHYAAQTITTTAATTYTMSAYVKNNGRGFVILNIANLSGATNYAAASFNLSTGAVVTTLANGTGYSVVSTSVTSAGNGWYRCTMTAVVGTTTATTASVALSTAGTIGAYGLDSYLGNGSGVFLWGAQLEAASAATTYTRNNGGVFPPRFDYDPVTLQPKGILIEEQRTNLFTYSGDLRDTAAAGATRPWIYDSASVSVDTIASPDGSTNADTVIEAANNSVHRIYEQINVTSGVAVTMSFYAKAKERTQVVGTGGTAAYGTQVRVLYDLSAVTATIQSGAVTATIIDVGNGWRKCTWTATPSVTTTGNHFIGLALSGNDTYLGNGTSGAYVWGAQLEAGASATSYIPTVASQVTRTADTPNIVAPNFAPWYNPSEGTVLVEFTPDIGLVANINRVLTISQGGVTARVVDLYMNGTNWVNYNGTTATAFGTASVTNTPQKIAIGYKSGDYAYVQNAGTVVAATSSLVNTPTQMAIGNTGGTSQLNGHIRSIRYYPTRLTNAQLQALTA